MNYDYEYIIDRLEEMYAETNPSEKDKEMFHYMICSLANPIRDYNYLVNKINETRKEPSRFEVTIKMGFETTEEIKEFKKIIKI